MFLNSLKFIRTVNHCMSMCAMYRCHDVKCYSALNSAASKQFGLLGRKPIMNNHDIRTMFIETQDTPNPNSLKFLPGTKVLEPGQSFDFVNIEATDCSPLAKMLFSIEGVKRVMFGPDFITIIKKDDNVDWTLVKPKVSATIMDFFASGSPVLNNAKPSGKTKINEDDDKTVKKVKELLDTKIRVIMHEHGGDVQFVDFKDGVLRLKMQGTCSSCPNSIDTLKNGVTNMMQFYVPEVLEVKQIDDGDKLSEKVHK